MMNPENKTVCLGYVVLVAICASVSLYGWHGALLGQVRDPLLTAKEVEDAPFLKPQITLQSALKLAESGLTRKADLRSYFLQEARLSYSKEGIPEPIWRFKWVKWGVRQSQNLPLEVTVSMSGVVSLP
jgi:hypothetical protein